MLDDGTAEAYAAIGSSLADTALAALASLAPLDTPEAPELDWLRRHARAARAGDRSQAQERRLTALAAALDLRPLEALALALALEIECDALLAHAVARLQGSPQAPGPLRPSLGLICRIGGAIGAGSSERERIAWLLCGRALASGALRAVAENVPVVERQLAVAEPLVAALIAPENGAAARPAFHPLRIEPAQDDALPLPGSWLNGVMREAKRLARVPNACLTLRAASAREARAVAARIARRLGRLPVFVDGATATARVLRDGVSTRVGDNHRAYPGGFEPWLIATGALPVVLAEPAPGETVRVAHFEFYAGPVIVIAGLEGEVEVTGHEGASSATWRLPLPSPEERAGVWRALLPEAGLAPQTIDRLAGTFRAGLSTLACLAQRAQVELVDAAGGDLVERLSAAAHDDEGSEARRAFAGLAHRVDARVPEAALVATRSLGRELELLLERCRAREALTDHLGVGSRTRYSPGVKVLFTGASGTGKTLAALWVAERLGKPVYRVDIAAVSSKYIGETEKNLSQLLARAEHSDCVLLFDEADSLFGNRTEVKQANDRFANTQTNYLLQRIEAFEGIAILTSNSKERLDDAFTRRLDGVIEFPLPDGAERRALWALHLGSAHALTAAQLNLLAAEADLAGGHIRNAVLGAALLARRRGAASALSFDDCVQALAMEYAKLGRRAPDGLLSRST